MQRNRQHHRAESLHPCYSNTLCQPATYQDSTATWTGKHSSSDSCQLSQLRLIPKPQFVTDRTCDKLCYTENVTKKVPLEHLTNLILLLGLKQQNIGSPLVITAFISLLIIFPQKHLWFLPHHLQAQGCTAASLFSEDGMQRDIKDN